MCGKRIEDSGQYSFFNGRGFVGPNAKPSKLIVITHGVQETRLNHQIDSNHYEIYLW